MTLKPTYATRTAALKPVEGFARSGDEGSSSRALSILTGVVLLTASGSLGCVPSIEDCDCGVPAGEFPDAEFLERSEDCVDADEDCGYPGPGANGYGYALGQVMENFTVKGCDGSDVELADFLQERPDNGLLNKGVIISLGASWCGPCQKEARLFAEHAPEGRENQIDFLHVLHEGVYEGVPTTEEVCMAWFEDETITNSAYPVVHDPLNDIDERMLMGDVGLPLFFAIDANANIRSRKPAGATLESKVLKKIMTDLVSNPYG